MKNLKSSLLRPTTLAALVLGGVALNFGCRPQAVAQQTVPDVKAPAPKAPALAATGPVAAGAPHADEINKFIEADAKQMPPQGAVLFIGSSSIRYWDTLAQDFPEIPVINRGFGGSLVEESTRYADRIAIPYKPKMIVMFAGTNDLDYGNKTPQQVFDDYKAFVAKVRESLPGVRMVYLSISPTKSRWKEEEKVLQANHLIQDWMILNNSPTNKLNFINTHDELLTANGQPPVNLERDDGLHFNKEGYKVWTALMKPEILALADMEGVERLDKDKN